MTAIVTGDVNAVYTLECAHRRQVLAARALNKRPLLIRGLPFPRTNTIGDVYIDGLVIPSVLQFSDVHIDSSPIKVQRGSTLAEEFWRGHLDGVAGTLGFALERRVFRSCSSRCWSLLQGQVGHSFNASSDGHSPSLSGEEHSPASTCPALQPRLWRQADDVE